jgi:hypothetical protein
MNFAKTTLLWIGVILRVSGGAAEGLPLPTAHVIREIDGWTVRVDERLLRREHAGVGLRALRLLESRLVAISFVVPEKALVKLRGVVVQLDYAHGELVPMQYHPDAGWLRENGYSERLAKCVHIPSVADFLDLRGIHGQPWVVLHELAHAYHDQVLGFEDARVAAAWRKFRDGGKYRNVLTVSGQRGEHYGLTDEKEFFAEMTEAYFGSNDFYPFVAGELREAEAEIYGLLGELWGPLPGEALAVVPVEEDLAFFEKKYGMKIDGVKPKEEYEDPDQFYAAIAEVLGIPERAREAAAKEFGWRETGGKKMMVMVKGGPVAGQSEGCWDVMLLRYAEDTKTGKPDPASMEQRMVQIGYDGAVRFPRVKEN